MGKRKLAKYEKTDIHKFSVKELMLLIGKYFSQEKMSVPAAEQESMARLICECSVTQYKNNERHLKEQKLFELISLVETTASSFQKKFSKITDSYPQIINDHCLWAEESRTALEKKLQSIGFEHGRDMLWVLSGKERSSPGGNQIAETLFKTLLTNIFLKKCKITNQLNLEKRLQKFGRFLNGLSAKKSWVKIEAPAKSSYLRELKKLRYYSVNESNVLNLFTPQSKNSSNKGDVIAFHQLEMKHLDKDRLLKLIKLAMSTDGTNN